MNDFSKKNPFLALFKKNRDLKLQVNDDDDSEEEAEVVRQETPRQEMPRPTRYVNFGYILVFLGNVYISISRHL